MIFRKYLPIFLCIIAFSFAGIGQVNAAKNKIYKMSPSNISKHIKKTKGQRRIIMIYASWCHYCVEKMPSIIALEKKKPNSIIAISVDDNQSHLARYIKKLGKIPFFVILNNGSESKLAASLKKFGVNPWQGVPYIIMLNENNKVSFQGNYSVSDIEDFLNGKW